MQNQNFVGETGERLCESILALDPSIIVASIGSSTGSELASANRPSMSLLIGEDANFRKEYASHLASIIERFRIGAPLLGDMHRIVTTYEKAKCIVIPNLTGGAFVAVMTTRDSESNKIVYEILKLVEKYSNL